MTKKKPQDKEESRFEIKKRPPKVKTDFFQNIPSFKHPLAEILNFPVQSTEPALGTQTPNIDALKPETTEQPEIKNLDTQNDSVLGTQPEPSNALKTGNIGHPDKNKLSAPAPKQQSNAPKKHSVLDAQTPKLINSGHSKNAKWRDYDKARSTVRVNLHISKEIDKKVRQYCLIGAQPKIELKEFYEQAAMYYLNFLDTQKITDLGAEAPLDDRRLKILYKTKPTIINLYLRYNTVFNEISSSGKGKWAARWSPRDDSIAQRYNEISPAIIELGIIQTQMNKGIGEGKIQTFKYYTDEIEKVLASGVSDEMLDTILQYHRQIWKQATGREIDLGFLESDK